MIVAANSLRSAPVPVREVSLTPVQEIRADIGLFPDRIIIAKRCQRPAFTVRICFSVSNELREPDGVTTAGGVLNDMRHHTKPVLIEQ